ncbi:MAG: aldose 1-epimerase family protein [Bacteroidia bacterium]|nr:aldose 1-epimerase family protein [Bacteroidia bacterium]MCF8445886.1 aldose 1-epimerase family protein [Bacteroidia bacterium]
MKIQVSENGAELISVKDISSEFEFMWNANPQVWNRHAPVLFPIVGKLNNNEVKIDGNNFQMGQHGFARDMVFEPIEVYSDLVQFMLESNEQTLEKFPFEFKFFIGYELVERTLKITYRVLNMGQKNMYFSVGAHPGFSLPIQDLSKYSIKFEKEENLTRHLLNNGLFNGEIENIGSNQNVLNLNSTLFEKDAIVLKNLESKWLKLVQNDSDFSIKMEMDDFPYFGIWTKAGQQAFICLEPWQGLADKINFSEEIENKEGIICLGPGSEHISSYTVEFNFG